MTDSEKRSVINSAAKANNVKLDPRFMSGDGNFTGSEGCKALAGEIYHTMMLSFRAQSPKQKNPFKNYAWKKSMMSLSKMLSDLDTPAAKTKIQAYRIQYTKLARKYPEPGGDTDLVAKVTPYIEQTIQGATIMMNRKNSKLAPVLETAIEDMKSILADINSKITDGKSAEARNDAQRIVNALIGWRDRCHAGTLTDAQSKKIMDEIKGHVKSWSGNIKLSALSTTTDALGIPESDPFESVINHGENVQELTQFFEVLESREADLQSYDEVSLQLKEARDRIAALEKEQEACFIAAQNGTMTVEDFAEKSKSIDNSIALEEITVGALTNTVANLEASALAMRAMINEFNTLKAYYIAYRNKPDVLAHIFSGIPYEAFIDVLDGTANTETEIKAKVYIQNIPERATEVATQVTVGATKIQEGAAKGRTETATFNLSSNRTTQQTATQTRAQNANSYMEEFMKRRMGAKATTPVTDTPSEFEIPVQENEKTESERRGISSDI